MNSLPADLQEINTWVFDLDNTLYHSSVNLFDQIDKRMCDYVSNFLNIPSADAYKIQKRFFREYGTTLRGLMECYNMDPGPYLDYVHSIDFSKIKADTIMLKALNLLPGAKIIFTNATSNYAKHVVKRLTIEDQIESIFDIVDAAYIPKPDPDVYLKFIEKFNIDPARSIMFEDMARNLEPAANLGMKTVWIQTGHPWAQTGVDTIEPDYTTKNLSHWLGQILGL